MSTPRASSPSISSNRTPRSTTTPLPITGVHPGVRMPLGSRCSAYFCSSADDDGVAGVVAAVELDDVVDPAAEDVGRLALALVAPLGADDGDRWHREGSFGWGPGHSVRDGQRIGSPAMDPLLVITNSDAGPADEESLHKALKVLRSHTSVEVQATSNPGELNSALHRAGSRRIIVAGGDGSLHAVVTTLYRRNDLKNAVLGILPLGTGNDFARDQRDPARDRGGRRGPRVGEPPSDGPGRRRGGRDRRQQRARRRRRAGQPPRREVEGPSARRRRRQGQPRQARLPDRRALRGREATVHPGPGRGGRRGGRRPRPARSSWSPSATAPTSAAAPS